jgi:hypothetical protein
MCLKEVPAIKGIATIRHRIARPAIIVIGVILKSILSFVYFHHINNQ